MPKLKNWYVQETRDALIICGDLSEHPRLKDGPDFHTSGVIAKDGNSVVTRNGTRYELLEAHPNVPDPEAYRTRLFDLLPDIDALVQAPALGQKPEPIF